MTGPRESSQKSPWSGRVVAVQPRIRLMRSFDERTHSYLGYVLRICGTCGEESGEFLVAVGEAAHKNWFIRIMSTQLHRAHRAKVEQRKEWAGSGQGDKTCNSS